MTISPSALLAAFDRRDSLAARGDLDLYRLFHGYGEEPACRLSVDRYGEVFLIRHQDPELVQPAFAALRERFGGEINVVVKDVSRQASLQDQAGRLLAGRLPEAHVVTEMGARFQVDLLGARNSGIFLDAREARDSVAQAAADLRVLNLFSYTAGFAVTALRGGAKSVLNVDDNKKVHLRGKANFALNGLRCDGRDFLRRDATVALQELAKRKRRFGLVVLDPPRSWKHKGKWVRGVDAYGQLLRASFPVLEPGGLIYALMTDRPLLEEGRGAELARASAAEAKLELEVVAEIPRCPVDFPGGAREPEHKGWVLKLP